VLAAIQRARTLLPFPILLIDADNGGEFINEAVITYCEQEHLTFTRGRPNVKNDQCNALAKEWSDCAKGSSATIAWLENTQARQL